MPTSFQPLISLTTDFGTADGYVAAMKGVILNILPSAQIVDISHEVTPFDIREGAYILNSVISYFPADAVHIVVIDPGVGSTRHPIAVSSDHGFFVAPDNGVLAPILAQLNVEKVIHLNKPAYWLSSLSHTFHGRDIFAPVGAYLARGVPLSSLGSEQPTWTTLPGWKPEREENKINGTILHTDRFGNLITNIPAADIENVQSGIVIRVAGHTLHGVQSHYAAVGRGQPLALIGSQNFLEISLREGNAATTWNVSVSAKVEVIFPAEAT